MALTIDRRTHPRVAPRALGTDIVIMRDGEKWTTPATLLNVSASGALIRSDLGLATYGRFRILLHKVPELGWIDAEIVRFAGQSEAGVRFITPFSPEFVQSATTQREPVREVSDRKTPNLGNSIPIW
jgi:hypothetical protein